MSFFGILIEILFPSAFYISTLFTGGAISYAVCKLYNTPFFNPVQRQEDKMNHIIDSIPISGGVYTFVYMIYSQHFLNFERKSSLKSTNDIIMYILCLEFLFYLYHRAAHTSTLYKKIHSQHHLNVVVYPIDYVDTNLLETTIIILVKNIPLALVRLHYYEYYFVYLLYSAGGFLTHSSRFTKFHSTHHKSFKTNFCNLFPIYDVVFGTCDVNTKVETIERKII